MEGEREGMRGAEEEARLAACAHPSPLDLPHLSTTRASPRPPPPSFFSPQSINTAFKSNWRNMRRLAVVAPLASMTGGGGSEQIFILLTRSVASFVKLYLLFLFLRVLLSWFPAFNWDRQPWLALRQLTDPYLNVFRGFVPPLLGSVDFTPLLGFFVLQTVEGYLEWLAFTEDELNEGYPDADY